jgi:hypothetical protein
MRKASALALIGLACALVSTSSSSAKGGVVARVLTPISRDAEPGTRVTVAWTLASVEHAKPAAFSAEGVFIRLFGPAGSHSARVYGLQLKPGRFRASIRVPPGGVRRVVIGLMGRSCGARGCRWAPSAFEIVGQPIR